MFTYDVFFEKGKKATSRTPSQREAESVRIELDSKDLDKIKAAAQKEMRRIGLKGFRYVKHYEVFNPQPVRHVFRLNGVSVVIHGIYPEKEYTDLYSLHCTFKGFSFVESALYHKDFIMSNLGMTEEDFNKVLVNW